MIVYKICSRKKSNHVFMYTGTRVHTAQKYQMLGTKTIDNAII